MPSISIPVALAGGAALTAGASVVGGTIQAKAAQQAGAEQAQAADTASNNTLSMFNTTQQNLAPFREAGQSALGTLGSELPSLTAPFNPTMAQLSGTPGYQFALQQGELATQNSFGAQGLGSSGAAIKGGIGYAEGLAGTTYQSQFQNYLTQNQQIYSMLSGLGGLGENAAALTGSQGLAATGQAGAFSTAGAAASAAGTVGAANATSNALTSTGATGQNLGLLLSLNQGGLFGTKGGAATGDDAL